MKRRGFFGALAGGAGALVFGKKAAAESQKEGKIKIFLAPKEWVEIDLDVPLEKQFKEDMLKRIRRVWSTRIVD